MPAWTLTSWAYPKKWQDHWQSPKKSLSGTMSELWSYADKEKSSIYWNPTMRRETTRMSSTLSNCTMLTKYRSTWTTGWLSRGVCRTETMSSSTGSRPYTGWAWWVTEWGSCRTTRSGWTCQCALRTTLTSTGTKWTCTSHSLTRLFPKSNTSLTFLSKLLRPRTTPRSWVSSKMPCWVCISSLWETLSWRRSK